MDEPNFAELGPKVEKLLRTPEALKIWLHQNRNKNLQPYPLDLFLEERLGEPDLWTNGVLVWLGGRQLAGLPDWVFPFVRWATRERHHVLAGRDLLEYFKEDQG